MSHAKLINDIDSKLSDINVRTKMLYPNIDLDDVLEKILDKIESYTNKSNNQK